MFLGSTTMYSSRSVDSRDLFLRISNLDYPFMHRMCSVKIVNIIHLQFLQSTFCAMKVYPRLEILRKIPRESTDLEEYIAVEPKNII